MNNGGVNLNNLVRELEGRLINDALKQTGGNKQAAARLLGLKRTTFSAKLRRCGVIAPASLDESGKARRAGNPMDEPIRPPQIMVVDDDQDTVAILARHLEREGFVPIEANSGAQCLKLVHENEVDVILLDLMMPEMDGFQVVKALRDDPVTAEIPIIMITARDDLDARAEGMRLGVSDFLAKPVFRRQLASRVRAQLEVVATARNATDTIDRLEAARKQSRAVSRLAAVRALHRSALRSSHPFDYKLVPDDRSHDHRFRDDKEKFAMNGETRKPQANVIAALAYLVFFVSGVIFLYLEPYNQDEFIRFHARQSIGFSLAWIGISHRVRGFYRRACRMASARCSVSFRPWSTSRWRFTGSS